MQRRAIVAAAAAAVAGAATLAAVLSPAAAGAATAVNSKITIGYSVQHRPIYAYRLGNPASSEKVVLLGQMHGDEHAGVVVAHSLTWGDRSVEGMDLWIVPTMNPDGDAAHTRQNAHHVDLNRNWPDHWAHLTGEFYSGPYALSEPETKAMYAFLLRIRPHYLVSLHQPLYGVDTTDGGARDRGFRDRLAADLGLPEKAFTCGGFCYGTMTAWYTAHYGIGETIEFGSNPSSYFLADKARSGIISALGGHFGYLWWHNPKTSLSVSVSPGAARVSGWAYDLDSPTGHVHYVASVDKRVVREAGAWSASPALDAQYHLTGAHAYAFTVALSAGAHTVCLVFGNLGAGTGNPTRCLTVTVPA